MRDHEVLLNAILANWNIMDEDVLFQGRRQARDEQIYHIETDAGTFEILASPCRVDGKVTGEYRIIDWTYAPVPQNPTAGFIFSPVTPGKDDSVVFHRFNGSTWDVVKEEESRG